MQCNYNSFIQIINFHGFFRKAPRCRKTGTCRILVPLRYLQELSWLSGWDPGLSTMRFLDQIHLPWQIRSWTLGQSTLSPLSNNLLLRSFKHVGPRIWNNLNGNIHVVACKSMCIFKKNLKQNLVNLYNTNWVAIFLSLLFYFLYYFFF